MKRKICVVTGSRAEYGCLVPLLEKIKRDKELTLQLVVTGMHLSVDFGLTYKDIEKDGFFIDEKIKILSGLDTSIGVSKSIGLAIESFPAAFERLKPDIILLIGDRFETFAAAIAAMICWIPIAHLSGGERTEGAIDEAMRHAITKMSHLHFTAIEEYRKRVIQLGEEPGRVFNFGEVGLDNLKRLKLLSKNELEKELDFKFAKRNLLVTFHPVTLERGASEEQSKCLLDALSALKNTNLIFTKTNADMEGSVINRLIDDYVAKNFRHAKAFTSMGQLKYLSTLQFVDAVVGNSSSGIVEAPSFKIGTINIGDRQKGRIMPESVINCAPTKSSIAKALEELYSKEFKKKLENIKNPYGDGNSATKIKNVLKNYKISGILKKHFYDIKIPTGEIV